MTYTYAKVGIELWGSKSIGECTQRQLDNVKSKRRVKYIFLNDILRNAKSPGGIVQNKLLGSLFLLMEH